MSHPLTVLVIWFMLGNFKLSAGESLSSSGALEKQDQSKVKDQIPEFFDCSLYLINPTIGGFYLSGDKKFLYFISTIASDLAGAEPKAYIYEINMMTRSSRLIAALQHSGSEFLIGHGRPLDGATIIDFTRGKIGCGEGVGNGSGIEWNKKKRVVKTFPLSKYKVLPTNNGLQLADVSHGFVQSFDFDSAQKRTLATFDKKIIPLYATFQPVRVYGFDPQKSELHKYYMASKKPESVFVLKGGLKLVQNGERFAAVEVAPDRRIFQIRAIKGWSGANFDRHEITLPEKWSADIIRVDYDFQTETALVQGADANIRRGLTGSHLKKVLVYQKSRGLIPAELAPAEDLYFSQAILTEDGKSVLVLARSTTDDGAKIFKEWNIKSGKWLSDIVLARPTSLHGDGKVKSDALK